MKKEFLLHKDRKERRYLAHIQAHLAAPTQGRTLRSQKSLHFANTPERLLTIREQILTVIRH
jgi:hypothetical protein